jgi:hypothetical protein
MFEVWIRHDKRIISRKEGGKMPGGDRTGPMGMGPMTGRATGYCGGYGRRNMFHATGLPGWIRFGAYSAPYGYREAGGKADPEAERQALGAQAEYLQKQLDSIRRRLDEIGGRDA